MSGAAHTAVGHCPAVPRDSIPPVEQELSKYEQEKLDGTRSASGAKHLTELRPIHMQIIELHMLGTKGRDIALQLGKSQTWISVVLHDPLVVEEIKQRHGFIRQELASLAQIAVDNMRELMSSDDPNIKLASTDKWLRSQGFYEKQGDKQGPITAEDIVAQLLAKTGDGESTSVTIGVTRQGRGAPSRQRDDTWNDTAPTLTAQQKRRQVTIASETIDHDPFE